MEPRADTNGMWYVVSDMWYHLLICGNSSSDFFSTTLPKSVNFCYLISGTDLWSRVYMSREIITKNKGKINVSWLNWIKKENRRKF